MSATRSIGGSSPPSLTRGVSSSASSWVWFSACALYGCLRWATMLSGPAQGRVFLSLLVAGACAAMLRRLPDGRLWRWMIAPVLLVGCALDFGAAGFSLASLVTGHLGRLESHVSAGLSTLSTVLVPYAGADRATIGVIVLGAGLLLLCAGAVFGTVREAPGTGRLALAAVPLLGLAVIPSAIVTPKLAYFHGLLTFVLGAGLVFSTRLPTERRGGAVTLLALAAATGAIGAGLVAGDNVWLRVATGTRVVSTVGTGSTDQFDWQQTYGEQAWPHAGATVLTVQAPRAAYWKAENLDAFNGVRWGPGTGSGGDLTRDGVSRAHLAAYSENITVSVGQLTSNLIIAAGYAATPTVIGAAPNVDPGTWITDDALGPGERYQVHVYVPHPSAAQLSAAGTHYAADLTSLRTLGALPAAYAGVESLSRQLAAGASNPYAYVQAVLGYLERGYTYTLDPPPGGQYPLAEFLLDTHRGYCQQFAGAMALLLRMHGIPARVAVGFSSGTRERGRDIYLVSDRDAHAWVEVWFPSFGWVTFDPTPGTAVSGNGASRADGGSHGVGAQGIPAGLASQSKTAEQRLAEHRAARGNRHGLGGGVGGTGAAGLHPNGPLGRILLAIFGALALAVFGLLAAAFWRRPSTAQLTAELERAFARCGRPLGSDVTFATLAGRLSDNPSAAAYVSALGAARYACDASTPTARGRAALRRWLAADLGIRGWTRAIWSLPPRRSPAPRP